MKWPFNNKNVRRLLTMSFFRVIAEVFSHGATHFIFLFIVGGLTAYIWFLNNHEEIKPHNIGIHVGYLSTYNENLRNKGLTPYPIRNLSMNIRLNSQEIQTITDGKYENGIGIDFDGQVVFRKITYRDIYKTPTGEKIKYTTEMMVDSVVVSLLCEPKLKDVKLDVRLDSVLWEETEITSEPEPIYKSTLIKTHDTIDWKMIQTDEGVILAKIFPLEFKDTSGLKDRKLRHHVNFYTNDFTPNDNNPYYYYYISFPNVNFEGILNVGFTFSDISQNIDYNLRYCKKKNLQYEFIYPTPDIIGNGYIKYFSDEKKELIRKNQGIIIQAVDIDLLNNLNKKNFLFSVLIGTGVAFILDIIIQLIRELHRFQLRGNIRRKENQSGTEE